MKEIEVSMTEEINKEHELFESSIKAGMAHAFRAGELLLQAKSSIKHGSFLGWIKSNCNFGIRTAQNYMSFYENREVLEKAKRNSHLTDGQLTVEEALHVIRAVKKHEEFQAKYERKVEEEKKERQNNKSAQVKEYMSAIFAFQKAIRDATEALAFGNFSPEAKRFTINKHGKVIEALKKFDELLEA